MPAARRLLLLGAVVLGLTALAEDGWYAEHSVLPPFSVRDLEGRELKPGDLSGKVVVIDFWASWCAPCVKELPELTAYYQKLRGRPELLFLSFSVEGAEDASAFAKKRPLPYPVYLAEAVSEPNAVDVFPTKLIVDARGTQPIVRFRHTGYVPVAEIEAKVEQVLSSPER